MKFELGRWQFFGLFAALAISFCARAAAAQTGLTVLAEPPPQYTFGEALAFQISAQSAANISAVTLFYRASGDTRTIADAVELTPGLIITAIHPVNLAERSLTPFTTVEYWWELRDTAGGQLLTAPQTFYYEDNRFAWQTLTQDLVTVHWYKGDTEFGQIALDLASHALTRANAEIRAPLPPEINIYIYGDDEDIRAVLATIGKAWVSGHADPALGVVMVAARPGLEATTQLERDIPHELTHLLVFNAVGGEAGYARVPTWLNEGLAVVQQSQPDPDNPALIQEMSAQGQLLNLKSLCGPFPADRLQAQLAYAQSESLVRFIREQFGSQRLAAMLAAYADGASCESGVQRGLGLSFDALETRWLTEVVKADDGAIRAEVLWPWVALIGLLLLSLLIFLALILRRPARSRPAKG